MRNAWLAFVVLVAMAVAMAAAAGCGSKSSKGMAPMSDEERKAEAMKMKAVYEEKAKQGPQKEPGYVPGH